MSAEPNTLTAPPLPPSEHRITTARTIAVGRTTSNDTAVRARHWYCAGNQATQGQEDKEYNFGNTKASGQDAKSSMSI
ncbi:hypothetical protein HQ545_05285 [Candidatus Woesearchaeota archaeon]|nr:hypothetical protein [Candidatus Woesearchaeota archaeon]